MTAKKRKIDCMQIRQMLVEIWDVTLQMQWRCPGYELVDSNSRASLGFVYEHPSRNLAPMHYTISSNAGTKYYNLDDAINAQAIRSISVHGWAEMLV